MKPQSFQPYACSIAENLAPVESAREGEKDVQQADKESTAPVSIFPQRGTKYRR